MSEIKRFTVGISHNVETMEQFLTGVFHDARMDETPAAPKVFVVAAAIDTFPVEPFLFRNYDLHQYVRLEHVRVEHSHPATR